MIPVLQSRWRLEGQYLMNYGLRQPLQPAPQRSWQTVSMHRKEQCEQLPGRDLRRPCPRAAGCVRSAVSSPGNALSSPLATHLPVPVGEKYHSASPHLLSAFSSVYDVPTNM